MGFFSTVCTKHVLDLLNNRFISVCLDNTLTKLLRAVDKCTTKSQLQYSASFGSHTTLGHYPPSSQTHLRLLDFFLTDGLKYSVFHMFEVFSFEFSKSHSSVLQTKPMVGYWYINLNSWTTSIYMIQHRSALMYWYIM